MIFFVNLNEYHFHFERIYYYFSLYGTKFSHCYWLALK